MVVAVSCALCFGVYSELRRTGRMQAALIVLQAANQADSVFTTDSLALELVRYFDHPLHVWNSANDRLMAHYLLGRCYADMGEAPRAIEEYSEAVEQADTTASDCDLHALRAVYGQMANVFHQQNLPKNGLQAQKNYVINRMGWANFYARTLHEYFKYGFPKVYEIKNTLEWNADQYMDYRNKNPL